MPLVILQIDDDDDELDESDIQIFALYVLEFDDCELLLIFDEVVLLMLDDDEVDDIIELLFNENADDETEVIVDAMLQLVEADDDEVLIDYVYIDISLEIELDE